MTDPEPAVVPVKVTEQLPVEDNVHLSALREPPVLPPVSEKVTVPPGIFGAVVVSVTLAVTIAVQLVTPRPILQEAGPTEVEVSSFTIVIVPEMPELPL